MHVAVDVVLCDGLGDALGALDVDVGQVEVLGGVVATNEVVDNVRVPHALLDRRRVAQIHFHEDDAAQVSGDLEVALGHLLAEGHNDAAQEACRAKNGRCVACVCVSGWAGVGAASAHLRARSVRRTRSEWAFRSCAHVSRLPSVRRAAAAPGDPDVVVEALGRAAGRGRKGRDAGGAQRGRHRCAGAGTAKRQGHGCGGQWLAGGWPAAVAARRADEHSKHPTTRRLTTTALTRPPTSNPPTRLNLPTPTPTHTHPMAMDTDTIPNLLGDARDQAPEELQEYFIAFEDYWERKLWHELTDKLVDFFEHPESAAQRIPFFETFIKSFANKINQLKLVTLGLSAATQFKGAPRVRQRPRRERQQARLPGRLRLRHSRRRQHPAAVTRRGGRQAEAGPVRAHPGRLRLGRDGRARQLLQGQRAVLPVQARVRRLLQERPPLPRLRRHHRPRAARPPVPRLRPQHRRPRLRLHLQLRRAAPAPHPRLARQHTARLAARPAVRLQPRRPQRLRRAVGQHLQGAAAEGAPDLPVPEDLARRPDRDHLPPPPARPRHDLLRDLPRDKGPAQGDRAPDHEGLELGPRQGPDRPGRRDCAHQLGPAQGPGYEADREHARAPEGVGRECEPAGQLDRGRRQGRVGRIRRDEMRQPA
ncbi:hypothetical protein OPT61_g7294 [Boeremia exigua]|uniref:Uncharacterized protein n=1 Tax=Boeremia exigua TaxID=749465 RepID=A0ACC2I2T5_9PLEO|nr:hypothetical protein OPT61_g7294 [Boeremia exigua]